MSSEKSRYNRGKAAAPILKRIWSIEIVLCLAYFFLGCWEFQTGLANPRHIGWVQGGSVYILGSIGCIWLVLRRRHTGRNALPYILLLAQLEAVTTRGIAWWNNEGNADWPIANSLAAAFIVILILWEEYGARKATPETGFEEKSFESDDTL